MICPAIRNKVNFDNQKHTTMSNQQEPNPANYEGSQQELNDLWARITIYLALIRTELEPATNEA